MPKPGVEAFSESFHKWVDLQSQMDGQYASLVKAAGEFADLCDSLRSGQKAKMQATIAGSNNMLFLGVGVSLFLGVAVALLITRMIVGPCAQVHEQRGRPLEPGLQRPSRREQQGRTWRQMATAINTSIGNTKKAFEDIKEAAQREKIAQEEQAEQERKVAEAEQKTQGRRGQTRARGRRCRA